MRRIGELYRIEAELRSLPAEARLIGRQERSASLITDMRAWLAHHRARIAGKSPLGEALARKILGWLCVFLTYGRIEVDNNAVERTIRPIALNHKNALFAGHDAERRTGRSSPRPLRLVSSTALIRGTTQDEQATEVCCRPHTDEAPYRTDTVAVSVGPSNIWKMTPRFSKW